MTNHTLWRAVGIKEWRNEVKELTANVVIEFWSRNQLGDMTMVGRRVIIVPLQGCPKNEALQYVGSREVQKTR
jgi:hypothetical protein